jgi:hypothetical protein
MTEFGCVGELRPAKLKASCTHERLLHWVCHSAFVEHLGPCASAENLIGLVCFPGQPSPGAVPPLSHSRTAPLS